MICLGLILPVRNRWTLCTSNILYQCQQQGFISYDSKDYLVVVDDGSTDETVASIESLYPSVHLLKGDGNLWWGGAINEGMKYLSKFPEVEAIVWLNDDLILPDDFMEKLRTTAQKAIDNNAIIAGLAVANFDQNWIAFGGRIQFKSLRYISDLEDDLNEASHLSGNIFILPRSIFNVVGYIDTLRFPHYNADYDYTNRARKKSIRLLLCRSLKAEIYYIKQDTIRYMPVWMQFYLEKEIYKKIKIFLNMRSVKFIYNIKTLVNAIDIKSTPKWWNYEFFYIRKILQCIFYTFLPKRKIRKIFLKYFELEQIHPRIVEEILGVL